MTIMTQQQHLNQEDEEMPVALDGTLPIEGPQPIEVVGQAEDASTAENQGGEETQGIRFTWIIKNFSRETRKKLYSDVFIVGGQKWRVVIFPKGNHVDHLSMYLDVPDSATLPYGWNRYAQFSLAVVNQIHPKFTLRKDTQHQFHARESDWGFTSFMALGDLYDPHRGYLVKDTCIIEADVAAPDSNKETGSLQLSPLKKNKRRSISPPPSPKSSSKPPPRTILSPVNEKQADPRPLETKESSPQEKGVSSQQLAPIITPPTSPKTKESDEQIKLVHPMMEEESLMQQHSPSPPSPPKVPTPPRSPRVASPQPVEEEDTPKEVVTPLETSQTAPSIYVGQEEAPTKVPSIPSEGILTLPAALQRLKALLQQPLDAIHASKEEIQALIAKASVLAKSENPTTFKRLLSIKLDLISTLHNWELVHTQQQTILPTLGAIQERKERVATIQGQLSQTGNQLSTYQADLQMVETSLVELMAKRSELQQHISKLQASREQLSTQLENQAPIVLPKGFLEDELEVHNEIYSDKLVEFQGKIQNIVNFIPDL